MSPNQQEDRIFLILEYAPNGNLFTYLKNLKEAELSDKFVLEIFYKVFNPGEVEGKIKLES